MKKSDRQSTRHREFLVHKPTNQVGVLVEGPAEAGRNQETIELASRERLCAPRAEFRPANELEIEEHHRAAALVQPLRLPRYLNTRLPNWPRGSGAGPGAGQISLAE